MSGHGGGGGGGGGPEQDPRGQFAVLPSSYSRRALRAKHKRLIMLREGRSQSLDSYEPEDDPARAEMLGEKQTKAHSWSYMTQYDHHVMAMRTCTLLHFMGCKNLVRRAVPTARSDLNANAHQNGDARRFQLHKWCCFLSCTKCASLCLRFEKQPDSSKKQKYPVCKVLCREVDSRFWSQRRRQSFRKPRAVRTGSSPRPTRPRCSGVTARCSSSPRRCSP